MRFQQAVHYKVKQWNKYEGWIRNKEDNGWKAASFRSVLEGSGTNAQRDTTS